MNIKFNNIGTNFEKIELYLDENDYLKLFHEEPSFGKLLKVYMELGDIISDNPQRLRNWVLGDARYAKLVDVTRKICKEFETYEDVPKKEKN